MELRRSRVTVCILGGDGLLSVLCNKIAVYRTDRVACASPGVGKLQPVNETGATTCCCDLR